MELPHFEGWHLIGAFPDGEPDDVGSWLLVHGKDAMLLEVPPGLTARAVRSVLKRAGAVLRFITASHSHEDHLDPDAWAAVTAAFPKAVAVHPADVSGDQLLHVGGEPVWLVKAPKHSTDDVVTVFRGVAMTGDIELGMLASVNNEVRWPTKMKSMDLLRGFERRTGYHVHSVVSAHLNDVRLSVRWDDLFGYADALRKVCRRCGGTLVRMEMDFAGFDRRCEDCGNTDWSDPRMK